MDTRDDEYWKDLKELVARAEASGDPVKVHLAGVFRTWQKAVRATIDAQNTLAQAGIGYEDQKRQTAARIVQAGLEIASANADLARLQALQDAVVAAEAVEDAALQNMSKQNAAYADPQGRYSAGDFGKK